MKKLLLIAAGVVASGLIFAGLTAPTASAATTNKVVYFVPHQDDETLTMGASIASHVKSGKEVHLVLTTDGSASGAFTEVNDRLRQEGRPTITKQQFSAARNREFVAAAKRLGVQERNIHYENIVDGKTSFTVAGNIIDKYVRMFPGAAFKSISWLDLHVDHYNLGYALNNRCVANPSIDCRFYQSARYQVGSTHPTAVANPSHQVPTPRYGRYTENVATQEAANEYKVWNPAQGRYAVGYTSTKVSFDWFLSRTRTSLWHMNDANWASSALRTQAENWLANVQK